MQDRRPGEPSHPGSRWSTRWIDLAIAAVVAHDLAFDLKPQAFKVWSEGDGRRSAHALAFLELSIGLRKNRKMLGTAGATTGDGGIDWAAILQTAFIAVGGLWALYIYWKTRKAEAVVALTMNFRTLHQGVGGETLIVIGLRVTNSAGVLFRHKSSRVDLLDASRLAGGGEGALALQLATFASQDPFLPVYGYEAESADEVRLGNSFWYHPNEPIELEPGEVVDCELAFPIVPNGDLLAARAVIEGYQGRAWNRWPLRLLNERKKWNWSTFAFVSPPIEAVAPGGNS